MTADNAGEERSRAYHLTLRAANELGKLYDDTVEPAARGYSPAEREVIRLGFARMKEELELFAEAMRLGPHEFPARKEARS